MLIAVEGISGVGKSTYCDYLTRAIESAGLTVGHVRGMQEPSADNPINEFIRHSILRDNRFMRLPYWAETFLLLANLAQNSYTLAKSGADITIRENYVYGFLAYQTARYLEEEEASTLTKCEHIQGLLQALVKASKEKHADKVYWVQIQQDLVAKRLNARMHDRHLPYSDTEHELQQSVFKEYESLLRLHHDLAIVNNDGSLDALAALAEVEAKKILQEFKVDRGRRPLVYIAGPLFTPAERCYLEQINHDLHDAGYRTYLPHKDGGLATAENAGRTAGFFHADIQAIQACDLVLAVLNGSEVDSGTAWEIGFAFSMHTPVMGIYEDTRSRDLNLMISNSVRICSREEIVATIRESFSAYSS